MRRRFSTAAVLAAVLLVPIASAHAQGVGAQTVDAILGEFKNATNGWTGKLQALATNTFMLLATCQLAWSLIKKAIERADLETVVALFVRELMRIGAFLWLLTETNQWGPWIIDSFRQAAGAVGGGPVAPGDILDAGIDIAGRIMAAMSIWEPEASTGLLISGIVILVAFVMITAQIVLALIESYIVVAVVTIFMAFGGSEVTDDIAVGAIRAVFAIGAKLFGALMIGSLGTNLIQSWVAKVGNNAAAVSTKDIAVEIASSLIFAVLAHSVPALIERMAGGSGVGAHPGALLGAAAATGAGVIGAGELASSGMKGLTGAATAAAAATELAETQMARSSALGIAPQSTMGRAAQIAGSTVKNIAGGVSRDLGRRLSGQTMTRGRAGFRIASDIQDQQKQLISNTPSLRGRQ